MTAKAEHKAPTASENKKPTKSAPKELPEYQLTVIPPGIITLIIENVACGTPFETACKEQGLDRGFVMRDIVRDGERFAALLRARTTSIMLWADDIDAMARNGEIEARKDMKYGRTAIDAAKLRIETRKWLMSKLMPKLFGDHVDISQNVRIEQQVIRVPAKKTRDVTNKATVKTSEANDVA